MTDVIDRIKSGKAKIALENDFGPVRAWEDKGDYGPVPVDKPPKTRSAERQKEINRASKALAEKIAAVSKDQPHVKLKQLPFDQWVRLHSRNFTEGGCDACLHLGKRNSLFSWCRCPICGEATYRVEELRRVVTPGINEQRYENVNFRETWGQVCMVCGWHERKRDSEYGRNTILDADGEPDGMNWMKT